MANINLIPEKVINANVYLDNGKLVGVADIELPQLQAMTDTISGCGIMGELESITLGHFSAMSAKFTFRTKTSDYFSLLEPSEHLLDVRAATQHRDGGTGELKVVAERYVIRGTMKNSSLGKIQPAKAEDSDLELAVTYLKQVLDGEEMFELDKINNIYNVNGTDYMADVRYAMGE